MVAIEGLLFCSKEYYEMFKGQDRSLYGAALADGFRSFIGLGPAALLVIMWSCFLSLTSMSCLLYVLLSMGAAGVAVQYLGYTPGLFIVGLFAILILWMYANFWITGTLFIVGGDDFSTECEYSTPVEEEEKLHSCKSASKPASTSSFVEKPKESVAKQVVREDVNSISEIKRILNSSDHYEALGFPRQKKIDFMLLKKEYHKKAMLVHPDKNLGSPLASESFKKLQCAYEVLSDVVKKRDYDEQLRKEESKRVLQRSASTSHQSTTTFCSEESRRVQCTKCGSSHIWVCTTRTKAKARWCQDCCQYHQVKDGDGWVEYRGSLVFDRPQKMEIPRAYVCAESRIFDVSEWAICQGMACRPNTHRPSFHVNMVGLEKSPQRSNSSRYPWDLDAEMMDEEDEFDLWLQQALASGLFCEPPKRRKSWTPFKLPQKKGKKHWRRSP
ncbi:UNVERIFIED_CONTAM: DnaJsubfamily A member 3, mitochondrial [Sesamum radiatum]|uniref:DnaJsubfamily A member 3, mitochondrial n=1 Tax=Sesamum radiatum TaxID=300843 RepID=A0AAW2K2E0_SESRA